MRKHTQPIPQNKFNAVHDFRDTFTSLVRTLVDGIDDDLFGSTEGFWARSAQIYEARILQCAKICDHLFDGTPHNNTVELNQFKHDFGEDECDYTYVYNAVTKNADILGRFEQLLLHKKDGQSEIVFAMANSGMGNYVFPKAKA